LPGLPNPCKNIRNEGNYHDRNNPVRKKLILTPDDMLFQKGE
jgi:hypothetical protein